MERSTLLKGGGVAVVLAVVVIGAGAYVLSTGYDQPSVESVESQFGDVNADTTAVNTRVVVTNPNDRTLPAATIKYTITMNDIVMAEGQKPGVRLEPGRNVIDIQADLDNGRIPAWWITHVERNERSTLVTEATASFGNLPFGLSLPAQNQTIESDLLEPFTNESVQSIEMANTTVLNISDKRATWGTPSDARTPILIRQTLHNRHNRTVTVDNFTYTVRLNDDVVGAGVDDGVELEPGENRTVTVEAGIATPRMEQWWISHLRRNQTTRMEVDVGAISTTVQGEQRRVALPGAGTRALTHTDFLGDGETTSLSLPTEEPTPFEQPTVGEVTHEWGEPNDSTTPILSAVPIDNPNQGNITDLLAVTFDRQTTVNDLVVATDRTTRNIDSGDQTVNLRTEMRNDDVPVWWARHINQDENSTIVTTTAAATDIGLTTFHVPRPDEHRSIETDLLTGFDNDTNQRVRSDGRTLLVVLETSGEWQRATPAEAPIDVQIRVRNEAPEEATIRNITYTVTLNDVTLADRTSPDTFRVDPLETRTLETTMTLNNSRMAEWWPTHIRRGERSTFSVEVYATVETDRETERVELESLGGNTTVETDFLGSG